jgi:hypothetical protein
LPLKMIRKILYLKFEHFNLTHGGDFVSVIRKSFINKLIERSYSWIQLKVKKCKIIRLIWNWMF